MITFLSLPLKKQLAFGLLIFERMLPSLVSFSRDTGRDSACFLKGRDVVWTELANNHGPVSTQRLREECDGNIPDTEEFSHRLTSFALNAALTMTELLDFIADRSTKHISYISSLATDSADLCASGLLDGAHSAQRDANLISHPLIQKELRTQPEDLWFLFRLPEEFDDEALAALKNRAMHQASLIP